MKARFRIRAKDPRTIPEGFATREDDGTPVIPYGLWDTVKHCWVDRFGDPSEDYWAYNRDVAVMRRRDLNHYVEDGWIR